jgi:hypothetical protein
MYFEFERRLISFPGSFGEYGHNLVVLLEYLSMREAKMLHFISENGLSDYCRWFGRGGIMPEMVTRVQENVDSLRSEKSVDPVKERLRKLKTGKIMKEITDVLARFCVGE